MKANAPERIWIEPASDLPKLSGHIDKDSVKYIREDTFIEKACQFLTEKHDSCIYEEFDPENRTYFINYDKIVDEFRKFMKGE